MAIFIAELGFSAQPELSSQAASALYSAALSAAAGRISKFSQLVN
jgi:hypothetical protein